MTYVLAGLLSAAIRTVLSCTPATVLLLIEDGPPDKVAVAAVIAGCSLITGFFCWHDGHAHKRKQRTPEYHR